MCKCYPNSLNFKNKTNYEKLALHSKLCFVLFFFPPNYIRMVCFVLFCLFRAVNTAFGGFQARGPNWSCSHWPMPEPQQHQIRNPQSEAKDRTHILMDPSWVWSEEPQRELTYCMSAIVLSHVQLLQPLSDADLYLFYKEGNPLGSERWSHLPKVTQRVSDLVRNWTQACWFHCTCSFHNIRQSQHCPSLTFHH